MLRPAPARPSPARRSPAPRPPRRTRPRAAAALLALALGAALALRAASSAPADAEEQPEGVRAALGLAAEFPKPDAALGFVFFAQGERRSADGASVLANLEFAVRVEPVTEGAWTGWRTTETWTAKSAQATSRRTVEAVFAPDLTPIRGSTYEEGMPVPTKLEWLGGEKGLALQLTAKEKRVLRSAWYAGQPVVEVGGAMLLARLLPAEFPRCQLDFCAPSWNKIAGDPQRFFGITLAGGDGPPIQIQEQNSPEVQTIETRSVQGFREDKALIFSILLRRSTGLPIMVMINGVTYAGQVQPL